MRSSTGAGAPASRARTSDHWGMQMAHVLGARRRWRGALTALAVAALATFAAGQASAAPATQTWTGGSAGLTPDIQADGFSLIGADGSTITTSGIAGTINFTLDGKAYVGYCTDTNRIFSTGTEPVDTTVSDPPASATDRAVAWILLNRAPTGADAPDKEATAAAAQVAVWLLTDPDINATTPTSDAALNAAAKALVQEALAATASPASVGVSATVPAAGATTSTVTVVGRAGSTVTLAVTGPATLSTTSIVLGANGQGTATLTATAVGTVGITATTAGDGRLIGINPTNPETNPQPTAAAEATTLSASAQVAFQAAPVTPVTPTVPVAQVKPSIAITKSGPARAKVLSKVSYTITVRNSGKVTLRNVVLRDRLPRGLSFVSATRTNTVANGNATFTIGTLAPGATRTVVVTLMANATVRGSRTNVATVSATNVRPKSAQAATVFRALVRRVQPAVTG